jgi:hypothetical protein
LAVFVVVFNFDDGVGYKITDFEGFSGVVSLLFSDFGPLGQHEDAGLHQSIHIQIS